MSSNVRQPASWKDWRLALIGECNSDVGGLRSMKRTHDSVAEIESVIDL